MRTGPTWIRLLPAVLAVCGLFGWLATEGHLGELFAQDSYTQSASSDGTQLPKADPANGKNVGEGKLPRTVPNKFSLVEGLDIGTDLGSAVDFTYKLPFTFTGKVETVTIELK